MSAMVTHFPREHARLLPHVKSLILNGRDALADRVRVGVSTNFNKLCGMDACTKADVARLDAAAVRALYGGVDFVGISAYPRYHGKLSEMEDSTRMFDEELKVHGAREWCCALCVGVVPCCVLCLFALCLCCACLRCACVVLCCAVLCCVECRGK